MLASTWSVALVGVAGHLVEVEADVSSGIPALTLVGLPDASLSEARERVRAAIPNSKAEWPNRKITLNLSPAALPKSGTGFDLAMAAAILLAVGQVPTDRLHDAVLIGELGLDGRVRGVAGVLPACLAAAEAGKSRVVVPTANAAEASLVPGIEVIPVHHLRQLVLWSRGDAEPDVVPVALDPHEPSSLDLAQVAGQREARWAVEVAAAGGHHLLLDGAPGAGKTMLAERLPGLLPPLLWEHALEVSAVHSVAGLLPPDKPLLMHPPFRAPHHNATVQALVGGGSPVRPGEASCAHRGVLFLDEAPEFPRGVLDALRQPLESGEVQISRARGSVRFPARFLLVMAANPCPCAKVGKSVLACECPPMRRAQYQSKLSGPLLDRVDMRVTVEPVTRAELLDDVASAESTEVVGKRVLMAREAAERRFAGTPWLVNADVPGHVWRERWPLERGVLVHAIKHLQDGALSARGLHRVTRLAWTIADLGGRAAPTQDDVVKALALRLPS